MLMALIVLAVSMLNKLVDAEPFPMTDEAAEKIIDDYGVRALARIKEWKKLMATQKNISDRDKLELVNRFFNKRRFLDDIDLWKEEDYWATPIEFLSINAGDCEDFSIAKYFTLKELGIPESKLRITYVKALELNQAHMVLTYAEKPGEVPLVLDNLINEIKPASKRKDLRPIYSFNGEGLWLAREMGQGKKGRQNRLARWSDLVDRM